jgi:glycosyltransferase involved in cell wall biosynthesis
MRILYQTTWFSLAPGDSNLANDLAMTLAKQGHDVQVILLDWNSPIGAETKHVNYAPGVNVISVAPQAIRGLGTFIERATKWLGSTWFAFSEMRRQLKGQKFDLHIGFAPQCLTVAQNLYASRICRSSYMILWDFFPYHHRSMGLISNSFVFNFALWFETIMVRRIDVIGCMTPANVNYLRNNYRLKSSQLTEVLPLWAPAERPEPVSRNEMRKAFDLPLDKKIVVFGGTLSEGRGIEDVFAAAEISATRYPDLMFLIIGDGRLADDVSARAEKSGSNLLYRKRIPRENYLQMLTACDAGLVCTVRNVDVPTFPSKTIDYLRAGIPIVASIEATTDFGAFIEENELGRVCLAGESEALAEISASVVSDPVLKAQIGERSRACLDRVFDVQKVARQVTAHALASQGQTA